jgi:hypothetical protein|tara:strand:- start:983 stop:1312 length:330 start_codon:yes stop_codon:yes gene_type:complete
MDIQEDFIGRVETGLMAEMGYHVGDTKGVKQKYRRLIIEDVIKGPIPLVGNKRYMSWWGNDKSERRLQAAKDFLRDKIYSPQHKNHYRAVSEWKEDLHWLEQIGEELIK